MANGELLTNRWQGHTLEVLKVQSPKHIPLGNSLIIVKTRIIELMREF